MSVRPTSDTLEKWARELDSSGDYRVLRRLRQRPIVGEAPKLHERVAIIVDTETTGLDCRRDEVIEIAMVAFTYDQQGSVGNVIGTFDSLREPSVPFGREITKLTGITPEMVQGRHLDQPALAAFVEPAALLIAHNAAFDRPMCEKLSSSFAKKPWACSATEIDWKHFGFEGTKLSYLLSQSGIFHSGHRALDDCFALLDILAQKLPGADVTALQCLLSSARKTRYRIWVRGTYEVRTFLKARGYKWNPGGNGLPRSWWIEIDESEKDAELSFLQTTYKLSSSARTVERMTAFNRFRIPKVAQSFAMPGNTAQVAYHNVANTIEHVNKR
jgi:DNA polymerase III subunit epsilon